MSSADVPVEKVNFRKRSIRARRKLSSDEKEDEEEEEHDISQKLSDMKALQKLRNRPNGVSIVGLTLGRKTVADEDGECTTDPFKSKSGGMVNMKTLKSGKLKKVDDAYETGIGTQFSAETNKRDEDEEMMKYIEEQLSKKKGNLKIKKGVKSEEKDMSSTEKYYSPEEAALLAVPDNLRTSSTQRSEEMLSNQMLSGIPEVDLGIDAKIRNIEATEEAKLKLIWSKHNKSDGPSQFVPSNITVNFIQQNKINIDENDSRKGQWKTKSTSAAQKHDDKRMKKKEGEKATDDYHYERFKKQFRRY